MNLLIMASSIKPTGVTMNKTIGILLIIVCLNIFNPRYGSFLHLLTFQTPIIFYHKINIIYKSKY